MWITKRLDADWKSFLIQILYIKCTAVVGKEVDQRNDVKKRYKEKTRSGR